MKKMLLMLGMVIFVYGTVLSKPDPDADSKTSINIGTVEQGKFTLNMTTEHHGVVEFKISTEKGNTIMNKRVSYDKSFSLPVNIADLKEGIYKIHVYAEDEQIEKEVFLSHLYKEDVAAFVTEPEDHVYNVKVFHENVPVTIKIQDKDGRVYHQETIKSSRNFEKRFDLTQLKEEDFSVVITGEKSYIVKSL